VSSCVLLYRKVRSFLVCRCLGEVFICAGGFSVLSVLLLIVVLCVFCGF